MRTTITALAALLLAAGCSSATARGHAASSPPPHTTAAAPASTAPPSYNLPSPAYATPSAADFTVTLKILSKQCFGSAGCNISYRPELGMNLPSGSLDPSTTYDVTYVVSGGDSGPVTDTLQITGDQYQQPDENEISTTNESTKLTVRVADVEPEG